MSFELLTTLLRLSLNVSITFVSLYSMLRSIITKEAATSDIVCKSKVVLIIVVQICDKSSTSTARSRAAAFSVIPRFIRL